MKMDRSERRVRAFEDLKWAARCHLKGENMDDLFRSALAEFDSLHREAMEEPET